MTDNAVLVIAVVGWALGIIALCSGWIILGGFAFSGIIFGLLGALRFVE
jgi:hypothetical protein